MKSFFHLFLLLPLLAACSDDFSDCEKIGHVKGGWQIEDCATTEIGCDPGQEDSVDCKILFDLSTEEGCRKFIDYANKEEEAAEYILRCPQTKSRSANKTSARYAISNGEYVYNDGATINMSDLAKDTENIYLIPTLEPDVYKYIDSIASDGRVVLNKYIK